MDSPEFIWIITETKTGKIVACYVSMRDIPEALVRNEQNYTIKSYGLIDSQRKS